MKTADLIPLILLELNTGDKYGFELTKAIEAKSNGAIIIKQPTLYTLLKKLEKSKFISSYWLDSDIGGKRHYYKLTENGKLQVSTLPAYDALISSALADDDSLALNLAGDPKKEQQQVLIQPQQEDIAQETRLSIMDALLANKTEPAESVLPKEEVFNETAELDNSTTLDIAMDNIEILKSEDEKTSNNFAENSSISTFTKFSPTPAPKVENTESVFEGFASMETDVNVAVDDVKYVNYTNFKQTAEYRQGKLVAKKLLLQALFSSLCITVLALLCLLITSFTGRSGWFYLIFITAGLIALFCPIMVALNLDNLRKKYQTIYYNPNIIQKLIVSLLLMLVILIISIIVSLTGTANSLGALLGGKNFANMYAPTLIACSAPASVLINYMLFRKKK